MSLDERAPLHSVSPSLAAPRKRNNSGDMAGTASQEGGQDCSEVLAAAGRLHIPETRTDTVPPSSDFFANLHTCSRPATFRKFTSQQLRKIFRSRHGFKLDRHDNIRVIIFRRVYPCIYRPCFHPVCRDRDQDLFSCFTGPTIVMLFQKNCGHRVLI